FFNYPDPQATEVPYKKPPKENNPVFRGIPLVVGSSIVAAVSPIATFLYNNAGFDKLRGLKELDDVECRYDPTVIPFKTAEDASIPSYTEASNLRAPPDATNRFYSVKDYHEAYK